MITVGGLEVGGLDWEVANSSGLLNKGTWVDMYRSVSLTGIIEMVNQTTIMPEKPMYRSANTGISGMAGNTWPGMIMLQIIGPTTFARNECEFTLTTSKLVC